ncbi:MAG: 4Fe-4S binding protein, partial [Clostridia bacterium]|nr:4Fe-4S binding protein [Clostridia bacterium]
MKAKIFEIKRFAVHDGDGIRTTVFLKGCPLKCVWCHNPEGLSNSPELAYYEHKCINCGECISVCPTGAHYFENGTHKFDRSKCIACGKCESVCLGKALTFYGKEYTANELLPI